MTPEERLARACRDVYGKDGNRSEAQLIVYENLVFTAKQPTATLGQGFETNQIMMNAGVSDYLWKYLETYVDSKPRDEQNQTQIKS